MPDLFISHASEDKEAIALPLADRLIQLGYDVWYDDYSLILGDSLRGKVDEGLASCRYGVVILSPHFLEKPWPVLELDALIAREVNERVKRVLPVWHNVDYPSVARVSPSLAGRLAVSSSRGLSAVVEAILRALESDTGGFDPQLRVKASETTDAEPGISLSVALADAAELMQRYLQPQPLAISEAVAELARRAIRSASALPAIADLKPYLRRGNAGARVVGYLGFQVAAQAGVNVGSWVLDLTVSVGDEIREAQATRETRPLWQ